MATFNSLQMTPPVYPVSGPGMGGRNEHVIRAFVDLSVTGSMNVGDVINLMGIHRNFRVLGGFLRSTGAAASVTLAVGDAAVPARYFPATAVTAAATTTVLAETGRDYLNTTRGTVIGTIGGAATGNTGTLTVVLIGIIEEPQ